MGAKAPICTRSLRSQITCDDSDAKALRSQISELLKPSDPRSKIPDHSDHSDAKAIRSEINFIDFSWILEPSGSNFGTSGASWRASWTLVTPRGSQDPPGSLLDSLPDPLGRDFGANLGPT